MSDTAIEVADKARIAEEKRVALSCLHEAWNEAMSEGVDPDVFAHAALFTALSDLILTYGEEAVAELAQGLPQRIESREFSVNPTLQ